MMKPVLAAPDLDKEFRVEADAVTPLENFLWKYSMKYTLYPWISLLEPTLETSYNVSEPTPKPE